MDYLTWEASDQIRDVIGEKETKRAIKRASKKDKAAGIATLKKALELIKKGWVKGAEGAIKLKPGEERGPFSYVRTEGFADAEIYEATHFCAIGAVHRADGTGEEMAAVVLNLLAGEKHKWDVTNLNDRPSTTQETMINHFQGAIKFLS